MVIANEELDYEHHVTFFRRLGALTGDPKQDAFCFRKAEHMHCLRVADAIRDVHLDVLPLSQAIENEEAGFQLRFGVGRRTKFIWLSLRKLFHIAEPERTEPLQMEELEEAAQCLNVIYINIRGTLDNLAWCLAYLFGDEKTRRLPPVKVHLFGAEFLKDANLGDVAAFMGSFSDWNDELRKRRDPAAHRIPLSIPPAALDKAAQEQYREIYAEYRTAFDVAVKAVRRVADASSYFEKADLLHDRLQQVGRFWPV
jgi:hypothetical protein